MRFKQHLTPLPPLCSRRGRIHLLILLGLTALCSPVSMVALEGKALAVKAPIHLIESVNLRSGPGPGFERVGGISRGTSPTFNCWVEGTRIGNNNVWFNVTVGYAGVTGYYSSYFDDSHYATNSQIRSKYRIPHCTGTSETIAGAKGAIAWMSARVGSRSLNGASFTAVYRAYLSAGVDITAGLPDQPANNSPDSFWAAAGDRRHPKDRSPPRGALLFFRSTASQPGHVGIATDSTHMISTSDRPTAGIHVERTWTYHPGRYLGWANPSIAGISQSKGSG